MTETRYRGEAKGVSKGPGTAAWSGLKERGLGGGGKGPHNCLTSHLPGPGSPAPSTGAKTTRAKDSAYLILLQSEEAFQ